MALTPTKRPRSLASPSVPSSPLPTGGATDRLSVIMENGDAPPVAPPRIFHRPFSRRHQLGDPPHHGDERPPPPYSPGLGGPELDDAEKLRDVRNRKFIAKRGGWRRLLLIALFVIALIVGLAVGLTVGLRKKHHGGAAQSTGSTSSPSPPRFSGPFPAGSYAFTTFLETVDTGCTANPSTWRCYPYQTYNDSSTLSAATFDWIISGTSPSRPTNYIITSSDNPFALTFDAEPLEFLDAGLSTERYVLRMSMDKVVIPSSPITDDDSIASCYYNGTTFVAQFFTRQEKTYPPASIFSSSSATPSQSTATNKDDFHPWPYAVQIEQVIQGGDHVPTCYKSKDGHLGGQVPNSPSLGPRTGSCSCLYRNWMSKTS